MNLIMITKSHGTLTFYVLCVSLIVPTAVLSTFFLPALNCFSTYIEDYPCQMPICQTGRGIMIYYPSHSYSYRKTHCCLLQQLCLLCFSQISFTPRAVSSFWNPIILTDVRSPISIAASLTASGLQRIALTTSQSSNASLIKGFLITFLMIQKVSVGLVHKNRRIGYSQALHSQLSQLLKVSDSFLNTLSKKCTPCTIDCCHAQASRRHSVQFQVPL